jgi:hypothetical protein
MWRRVLGRRNAAAVDAPLGVRVGLLPVLQGLRPGLDSLEIGIDPVGPGGRSGAALGGFLAARQLLGAPLLLLALALTLLL